MTYKQLQMLTPATFKRACGVNHKTFLTMAEVLKPHLNRQDKCGGQNSLSVEDQLLVTLQYWREYRTQFHISLDLGVSESTVCRIVEKVETRLVQSGRFRLPGKRQLQQPDSDSNVLVVDVAEVAIECPKKTATLLRWQAKTPYPQSSACN